MENVPLATRQNMFFQQDGCPAHNAHIIRQYLNEQFNEKWIGTHSSIPWPPRSPDLTCLDYFLWGYLKNKVCMHVCSITFYTHFIFKIVLFNL